MKKLRFNIYKNPLIASADNACNNCGDKPIMH